MKTFISILLISISLSISAQNLHYRSNKWKELAVDIASISLNALGDGLNDNGKKGIGHVCNALSIGVLLTSPWVIDYKQGYWYEYLLTYTFLRFGMFDPIYNTTRGLPFNYLGTTAPTDRMLRYFGGQPTFIHGLSLIVGFSIPLKYL